MIDEQVIVSLLRRIDNLEKQVERLQLVEYTRHQYDESSVSSPPTDAELDSAFGAASQRPNGFVGFVYDTTGGSHYICWVTNTSNWAYIQGTQAA